ncbi:MAG: hypothetical protein ACE5JK_06820, partial [Candidatus Omnitrophota bacterium]
YYALALKIIGDKEKHDQILTILREFYDLLYVGDILRIKEMIRSRTAYGETPAAGAEDGSKGEGGGELNLNQMLDWIRDAKDENDEI